MRVLELRDRFAISGLVLTERDKPHPGPREVLVKITAASLNYRDLLVVEGRYNPKIALPLIPVSDGAGIIEAVGHGVTTLKAGDRVLPIFCQGWMDGAPDMEKLATALGADIDGVLSEYRVFPQAGVLRTPDHLSDAEGATLPCAGMTAWNAVITHGGIEPGQVVVVQGTGGVALFALQFAKLMGAVAIVTSSSDQKLERAKALGADHLVNYKTQPDWSRSVKSLTGGRGADLVIEIGGAGTLEQSLRAIKVGGTIAMIGVLTGATASAISLPLAVMRQVRMQGIAVGSRRDFAAMLRAYSTHGLRPVIDGARFSLESVPEAFQHMADGQHIGKIVINI